MNYATQLVRDLLWAVNSPALLKTTDDHCCDSNVWGLKEQDIQAAHLVDFMTSRNVRSLGKYFEGLVSYWLHHLRRVDVLFESFAIREQKRTVGEIDFIFIDEQNRVTHWEVAVKFYLFSPLSHGLGSHYLGPNAVDTLDRKIERIFGQQLPRSKKCFPNVELRQAFVKGRIFYPLMHQRELPEHPHLSCTHLDGSWLRQADIGQQGGDPVWRAENVRYQVLDKPHWLSVVDGPAVSDHLMPFGDFLFCMNRHFSDSQRCPLVVQLESDGVGYVETRRFFVVPDCWPH